MSTMTKTRTQTPATTPARHPFLALREEFDELMNRFFRGEPEKTWFAGAFAPSADLVERDNAFEIRMDIPGVEAKDFDVQVHGNMVTVSGQRKEEKEEKDAKYHRVERRSGTFSRSFTLPCDVNEDEVAAQYDAGILTVKLPKCEESKSKRVTVKG